MSAAHYQAEHLVLDLRAVGALLSGSALTDPSVEVPDGHYAWDTMRATVVPNRNMIIASVLIGLGLAMLMQPWSLEIYSWSFAVLLAGVAGYTVAGKLH